MAEWLGGKETKAYGDLMREGPGPSLLPLRGGKQSTECLGVVGGLGKPRADQCGPALGLSGSSQLLRNT